jgi:hypothetical protein
MAVSRRLPPPLILVNTAVLTSDIGDGMHPRADPPQSRSV